mmetsp:Transcript_37783/g.70930  ORF Transcript_37783/g.70930 Transcript_37783/m.70930 type:complete len:364 (+) Transcript_37783:299-1390(+)
MHNDENGRDEHQDDREREYEELLESNKLLQKEINLFDSYLQRVNPQLAAAADDDEPKGKKGKGGKKAGKSRALTADEKYEVASTEIEVLQAENEQIHNEGEKTLDELRSMMEETDLRIAETKKDTYEFKRDIVVGAENFRTGKTVAEKMLRYMEGVASSKDAMIEKLRLKNATLKSHITKMEQQLQQKEEMGEVLHVIDFDQLKIENQQYLEKIEERNNELLRLKLTTGKTVQVLNNLKKKLGNLTTQSDFLRKETAERKEQLSLFQENLSRVTDERAHAQKQNRILKHEQEDTEQPQVIDYIKLKADVAELEKKEQDWQRKIEIGESVVLSLRKSLRMSQARGLPGLGTASTLGGMPGQGPM